MIRLIKIKNGELNIWYLIVGHRKAQLIEYVRPSFIYSNYRDTLMEANRILTESLGLEHGQVIRSYNTLNGKNPGNTISALSVPEVFSQFMYGNYVGSETIDVGETLRRAGFYIMYRLNGGDEVNERYLIK